MASIFTDSRFAPFLQATPMSGRIADPVSLFTRWVPPVREKKKEEDKKEVAQITPVTPNYQNRSFIPSVGEDGGVNLIPTESGGFFTDLKGLASPITDLFTTSPEVTSTATAPVAYDPSQDLGPFANVGPALQSAPISPVEVSFFPAPVGLKPNPALQLQQDIAREANPIDPVVARETPLNAFTTAELNQFNSPFSPDLPGAMTMDMASNQTPVDAAVAAPQTGQQQAVDPATIGVTDPVTGVTTYGDQFMTAPAPDPYEAGMLSGVKGLFGYPDDRTYAGGRFNALGEDTTRKGYEEDDKMRGLASKGFSFVAPNIMGPIMEGITAGSRIGAGTPYGRDGAGNFRFNAAGPMGTIQSPYGVLNTGPAYGNVATGDYSGLYGLGTLYNTGRSQTPMMFDMDGRHKAGAHGYGLGFKADGSFGSLDMFDVQDVDAIYENTRDFSFNPDDQGGGGDGGGGTDDSAGGGFGADMGAGDEGSFY